MEESTLPGSDACDRSEATAVRSLKAKLARSNAHIRFLKHRLAIYEGTTARVIRLGNYLVAGPGLTEALDRWDRAFSSSNGSLAQRIPHAESVEVVAAYLRRRAYSGVAIAALAVLPSLVTLGLLWQQNAKIDQQIFLMAANQARESKDELRSALQAIHRHASNSCRSTSTSTAIGLPLTPGKSGSDPELKAAGWEIETSECWSDQVSAGPLSRREWLHDFNKTAFSASWIAPDKVVSSRQEGSRYRATLAPPDYLLGMSLPMTEDLQRELVSTSHFMRPYRLMIDSDGQDAVPRLSTEVFSPERGAVLKELASRKISAINFDASRAWAPGSLFSELSWEGVSLAGSMMECSDFRAGRFTNVNMTKGLFINANFDFADLRELNEWNEADFTRASFRWALMPHAATFHPKTIEHADFQEAIVPEANWHLKLPEHLADEMAKTDYYYTKLDKLETQDGWAQPKTNKPERMQWVMRHRKEPSPVANDPTMHRVSCKFRMSQGFRLE